MVLAVLSKNLLKSLRVVVMPKLSPTMTHGRVLKLTLAPAQSVNSYDKIMEVSTRSLLNISDDVAEMDIEIMEDMYVASVFAKDGQELSVGSPIAVLCDHAKDIQIAQSIQLPATYNSYAEKHGHQGDAREDIPVAIWQAYAKVEVEGCK